MFVYNRYNASMLICLILSYLVFVYLVMNNSNPRITNYISTTKDENNASRIISEIRQMENPTVHFILCKFLECPIIKEQPEFIEILFEDHINVIIEMIEWMLTPKLVARKKKIKSNLDFFPFRCKQFIKDNIVFYEQLYLYARSEKLPINVCFNFLDKEFFDKDTIYTALGYFAEVMIPFAKYEFSASTNLTQSLQLNSSATKSQTLSIMKILPKQLIEKLIQHCHYEPIFQFIKTAILVSIQDVNDYQVSKYTMLKILKKSQTLNICEKLKDASPEKTEEIQFNIDILENVSSCLKELVTNIEPGNAMHLRIQSLIFIVLESKTIPYAINEILQSKYCNGPPIREEMLYSSLDLSSIPMNSSEVPLVRASSKLSNISAKTQLNSSSPSFFESQQQDLLEILLKILTYSVEIFIKIPKATPTIKITSEELDLKHDRELNYRMLISIFRQQMQGLLTSLEVMTRIVFIEGELGSAVKPIPFSSGQKIRPVTFMRFQYLKLMQNCLVMLQYKDSNQGSQKLGQSKLLKKSNSISLSPFEVDFEKLHVISIIEKYLNQNRWNNITLQLLEKICHSMIVCSYEYLRKNIEKDKNKKVTQSFLAFLIENFTQRDYIFLNTFKFTTQGNLQSIYNISKDLAYTLNSTNELVVLLNEFAPWKKFILNDLKVYQEKTYPVSIKPEGSQNQETSSNEVAGLKVDEADSIRKLIENISSAKKWPTKISKYKGNSKSGILNAVQRNSGQSSESDQPTSMTKSHGFYTRNANLKKETKKTLNDFLKKRVEHSIEYQNDSSINEMDFSSKVSSKQSEKTTKSEIKIQDKEEAYEFFKNYSSGIGKKKPENFP